MAILLIGVNRSPLKANIVEAVATAQCGLLSQSFWTSVSGLARCSAEDARLVPAPWRFCDAACWSARLPIVSGVAETCTTPERQAARHFEDLTRVSMRRGKA